MKTIRIALLLALIVAILIPSVAFAQDEELYPRPNLDRYYCSWDVGPGGDGSYNDPWVCKNQQQINNAINRVCRMGGGILFQIEEDGYWRYVIRWLDDNECDVRRTYHRGYPPRTGIALPPTLAFSGALVLGLSLFAVGLVVFRKRSAN